MEPPKLLVNKPKKSQRKPVQHPPSSTSSASIATSSPASASASASPGSASASAQQPKESFVRRYKYLWPILLAVNFSVGAYLFMRTKKKDEGTAKEVKGTEEAKDVATSSVPPTVTLIVEPIKPREPIPEGQQRELFKWILEEKRKIKPRDAEEKKRIDEEKAILKHFIDSKSIPTL